MARLLRLWAALACLISQCIAASPSPVPDLTLKTFSPFIEEHETVLVNFCAPYGGHCKAFAPKFERAAKFLIERNIHLATYDCTAWYDNDYNMCGNMGIKAYPTILLYHGDTTSPTIYTGPRKTAEDMIYYMTNETQPTSSVSTPTSTKMPLKPSKTPPANPSPNPTASNAVWLAEDGSRALIKLAIPGLLDPSITTAIREERSARRNRRILFLRHRLQKAFLSREPNTPSPEDLTGLSKLFSELESFENLEKSVLDYTKIHKVLRNTMKLSTIPGEFEYDLRERGLALIREYENTLAGVQKPTPDLSVILNFTISANGRHLLLNSNYHALQVPDPSRPALLQARKVPSDTSLEHLTEDNLSKYPLIELDYSLDARNRDDPGISYHNYHPDLFFNLIGTGGGKENASDPLLLLDSLDQKWVNLELSDTSGGSSDSPNRRYRIDKVRFKERSRDVMGRKIEYRAPRPDDRLCSRWSWRCADIGDPPWYKDIWRVNFDEFGRVGSLRRRVLILWLQVKAVVFDVPWWAGVLACIALGMYVRGRLAGRMKDQEWDLEKGKDRTG